MKLFLLLYSIAILSESNNEWTTYYQNEQLEIQFKKADCHDNSNGIHQEKILVKYVNKTNEKLNVSFSRKAVYSNSTTNSSGNENQHQVTLQPNETKTGTCSDRDKTLAVFSKHLDIKAGELKSIDFENITIKTNL